MTVSTKTWFYQDSQHKINMIDFVCPPQQSNLHIKDAYFIRSCLLSQNIHMQFLSALNMQHERSISNINTKKLSPHDRYLLTL